MYPEVIMENDILLIIILITDKLNWNDNSISIRLKIKSLL